MPLFTPGKRIGRRHSMAAEQVREASGIAHDGMTHIAIGRILCQDNKTLKSAVLGLGRYAASQETQGTP